MINDAPLVFHLWDCRNVTSASDVLVTSEVDYVRKEGVVERDHTILYFARGVGKFVVAEAMNKLAEIGCRCEQSPLKLSQPST